MYAVFFSFGAACLRCISALTESGITLLIAPSSFVFMDSENTWSLLSMSELDVPAGLHSAGVAASKKILQQCCRILFSTLDDEVYFRRGSFSSA